ncbi:hypothetical protein BKA82DRAFT_871661 [Pisolithus tinctorius]|uniref:Uncharacterized protein n=1 Tax=Pisolithus tinctorius Marx 270 TaxID=870435 RepID=A0A0C3JND2_PISTI|nr:hypothetical protein BKA82DRAFT_871661 [Pisolithus tinctorius]KIO10703.1 hypothetical protein M404DRAFT_871661 [Pisolithus tinctorius Marx 270]
MLVSTFAPPDYSLCLVIRGLFEVAHRGLSSWTSLIDVGLAVKTAIVVFVLAMRNLLCALNRRYARRCSEHWTQYIHSIIARTEIQFLKNHLTFQQNCNCIPSGANVVG